MSQLNELIFNPSKYNILIVDDSKSVNKIILNKCEELGYNCFQAFTLAQARKILETENIHYLFLDINLPDGTGFELIKQLEDTPEKIFVLTSEKDVQLRDIAFQKGVIDFIVKDKSFFNKIEQLSKVIERFEKNKNKNILVVDDSKVIQEQLKEILTNRYYNVQIASNGVETLNILNNTEIDLILLDLELGGTNGLEFLQNNHTLIINEKNIPVLIVTGHVESNTIRDAIKTGAVDVIKKPYVIEELVLKADLWIDYRRKEQELAYYQQKYTNSLD